MAQTCKYAVEIEHISLMNEDSTLSLYKTYEEAVTAFQEECLNTIPHLSKIVKLNKLLCHVKDGRCWYFEVLENIATVRV